MAQKVNSQQWAELDTWWDTFVSDEPDVLIPELLDTWTSVSSGPDWWTTLDGWWETCYRAAAPESLDSGAAIVDDTLWPEWDNLDIWWDDYKTVQQRDFVELRNLIMDLDEKWESSNSRFDTDPLHAEWTDQANSTVPLRTSQEENWSHWLASLLEASSGEFTKHLFGDDVDDLPISVEREAYLPEPNGSDRFADILVFYEDQAISIEVKQDDTAYKKTLHTATLVEQHHDYDWQHVLLVPAHYTPNVSRAFPDLSYDGGQPEIRARHSHPIQLFYWRDVSRALRTVLLSEQEQDPHWEASAYLLCTLIEQRVMTCNSVPRAKEVINAGSVVEMSRALSTAMEDVGEQLKYIREIIQAHE